MSTNRVEGAVDKGVGAVKEAAGKATGDRELEAKGAGERTMGKVQKGVGNLKDAARNALKH